MPRRQQTDYRPPTANVEPVATPLSRPFVPRLGPETLLPVQELASLSKTLAGISVQQAEEDAKVKQQQGLDAAAGAPPDVLEAFAAANREQDTVEGRQKASQKVFADLVKAGKIHVSEDPWAHVGFVQGMSHRLMAGYDQKLNARLAETTATQDADGNPVLAKSPDAVAAEVWAEYKDNPLLQNYYGSQVARQMKTAADAKFTEQSSRILGDNRVKDTVTWSQNVLTDKLFAQAVAGEDPTADDWATVRSWGEEVTLKTGGLADLRKIKSQALRSAAGRLDSADDGEGAESKAAAFLRGMRDMPVGSTTAGKDAVVSLELEALIDEYEERHKTKAERAGAKEANEDRAAIATGLREYYQALDAARSTGAEVGDPQKVLDEYSTRIREDNRFGDRTGLVVNAIQGATLESNQREGALQAGAMLRSLEAGGDPDQILFEATLMHTGGGMDRDGFQAIERAVAAKKSVRHLVEESPLSVSAHRSLEAGASIPGIPTAYEGQIGLQAQADQRALVEDYNRREFAAAQEINGLPRAQQEAALRKWHEENDRPVFEALRQVGLDWNKSRVESRAGIQALLNQSQSAEQMIADAEAKGLIAQDEAREYREASFNGTDVEQMRRGEAYKDGEAFVLNQVNAQYEGNPNLVDIQETARRELRRAFDESIGEKLVGSDPSKRNAIIRAAAEEQADGVVERVGKSRIVRLTEAAKPGEEGVPSANELLDFGESDLEIAQAARAAEGRGQLAEVLATPSPNVPSVITDYQSAFLRATSSPGFSSQLPALGLFQMIERDDIENRAYVEAGTILTNDRLSDQEKAQAVVDMYKVTGVPFDSLVAGEFSTDPSGKWRTNTEAYIQRLDEFGSGASLAAVRQLRAGMAATPPTVSLEGVKIGPYTTPWAKTEAEFDNIVRTREPELRAMALKYGVPDGDPAFREFIRQQKRAIKRLNQE